jgi:putative transcriptional regulator
MNNSLRDRREEHGLSQVDLTDAVEVSRQTINATERDRYDPSLVAFKLAGHFDCRIEELFDLDLDSA